MTLEAIRYEAPPRPIESGQGPGTLSILDQILLPHTTKYIPILSAEDAFQAIRSMQVRGAPAIAIVAALSLCVELSHIIHRARLPEKEAEVVSMIEEKLNHLLLSRPTAVNLGDAIGKLKQVVDASVRMGNRTGPYETVEAYIDAAEQMLNDDISDNLAIGEHGADWILAHAPPSKSGKVSVLTHCNTGALATSGHGTALGVIRTLHSRSSLHHAFFTETRPYNQGSRLTAYELLHDHIPSTLITDSMAASLLRLRASAEEDHIVAVVVGADRVAANGDTANKIGTYALAILARFHGVKFLVAAPRTTIDLTTPSGEYIVIEQRRGEEVTMGKGPRCDEDGNVYDDAMSELVTIRVAAKGVEVWNPAFDVTPSDLIDGIITEKGVVEKNNEGEFELSMLFSSTAR